MPVTRIASETDSVTPSAAAAQDEAEPVAPVQLLRPIGPSAIAFPFRSTIRVADGRATRR